MVSMLTGCGASDGWKVISLEEANGGKETLKVVKESDVKTLGEDSIFHVPSMFDASRREFLQYQYVIDDIGNGKEVIKNVYNGETIEVNKDKFGEDETVKSILASGINSYIIDNYIIIYVPNPDYKESDKHVGEYKEIKWYNLETEEWNKYECKKDDYITHIVIGYYDNKVYTLLYEDNKEVDDDNLIENTNEKIQCLNLKTAELKIEKNLDIKGTAYLDFDYLDKNRMIFTNVPNPKTVVRVLDFKNRIFSELLNKDLSADTSTYMLTDNFSPLKDRFFYTTENDGIISVYVMVVGEDDKVKAEGKVFEYKKGDELHINWDKSGKKLIISENIALNGTPQNYRVLEFNM
ncbi:hypothetical protein [Clostridium sp. B9]|uniref:hypothetical protein n=1 Tax=Clostridium sp. B9 TaxID=3423224 RepID=UPI003D2ED2B2